MAEAWGARSEGKAQLERHLEVCVPTGQELKMDPKQGRG